MMFGVENLECCGYPVVKKFQDRFIRFDRQTLHDGIPRAYV